MIPIILTGKNLGERHRQLNNAVNAAFNGNEDFEKLKDQTEQSPVDKIFKINLASKLRNTDYIIKTLKNADMLYVSVALKSKWLLESQYEHIIHPEHLEVNLYPSMTTTAVTKMKHWIFLNLKNPERCQQFYRYYINIDFKLAIKFLRNCSSEFIRKAFIEHIHKISPSNFKILCEKDPFIANMYFDALLTDVELVDLYIADRKRCFDALKYSVKCNTNIVLDISENFFDDRCMQGFGSNATKFIIKHHRERFLQKPELYATLLLNFSTLASCLSSEDAMNLVLTLARDQYSNAGGWGQYKKLEPLLKRLEPRDMGAFKKKVFIEKDFGTIIENWPYSKPSLPNIVEKTNIMFKDFSFYLGKYTKNEYDYRCMLKKRKYAKWANVSKTKTMLDKLFDEYRVASFEKTLFELRKRIKAESSSQNRQYMMLVLVSKSGGHVNNIVSLIRLLANYKNEPSQERATIIRSLVKRANAWRVPDATWNELLEFAHGLGLDGKLSEAECVEGIHAVLIRQILSNDECDFNIVSTYLANFSTLKEYSFSNAEKDVISDKLPKILFSNIYKETDVRHSKNIIEKLLAVLTAYELSIEKFPGFISTLQSLAVSNICLFSDILITLFEAKTARRQLFRMNLEVINTEEIYLNALRFDIEAISPQKLVNFIKEQNNRPLTYYQRLFQKISIYFNEELGLAKTILHNIKSENHNILTAKYLSILLGDQLMPYLKNADNSVRGTKDKTFTAAIRANIHLARPAFDINTFGWPDIGTKAVANKVMVCSSTKINNYIKRLLENKRTIKLAYILAKRTDDYFDSIRILSKVKPTAAIKFGFKIIQDDKEPENTIIRIWDIIKPLIEMFDITSKDKYVKFPDVLNMPLLIQPMYSISLHKAYRKISFYESMPVLSHIEHLLPNINENFIEAVILEFLKDGIPKAHADGNDDSDYIINCECLYIRLIIKYLLLCKSKDIQIKRNEIVGAPFFDKMEFWFHTRKKDFCIYLDEVLSTLKYYKVYLNREYLACMPIMTKTLEWMKKYIPIEKHLKRYIHMHVNMLYYAAVKESTNLLPNHCINETNEKEARKIVGNIFGRYLSQEIKTLKVEYFNSALYLYKDIILNLGDKYFHFGERIFTEALIYGVLDQSDNTDNVLLAVYLLKEYSHCLETKARKEILHRIVECKDIEVQMVFYATFF